MDDDDAVDGVYMSCFVCTGDAFSIGVLGLLNYYQCADCGALMTPQVLAEYAESDQL